MATCFLLYPAVVTSLLFFKEKPNSNTRCVLKSLLKYSTLASCGIAVTSGLQRAWTERNTPTDADFVEDVKRSHLNTYEQANQTSRDFRKSSKDRQLIANTLKLIEERKSLPHEKRSLLKSLITDYETKSNQMSAKAREIELATAQLVKPAATNA